MKPEAYRIEREVTADHWWFHGRRVILARLLDGLRLPPAARILDVGCGTGANTPILARYGTVVGVDMAAAALRDAPGERERLPIRALIHRLPVADGCFDLVTGFDVLEHLDDDLAAAAEMRRVLAPGGQALVFVPALPVLWGLQDEISEHRRRYTARSLRRTLEGAGFRIRRLSYFNTALFPVVLAGRLAMRTGLWRPAVQSENELTGPLLNRVLGTVFAAEAPLLEHVGFPVGVSLLAIASPR